MVLWVVALSARDTIMRWILSHSLTMNSFWAFRTGLMIASPYWLGCLKPTREVRTLSLYRTDPCSGARTGIRTNAYDNLIQSLYLLNYIDSASLRQNVQRAVNRGESYHQLRRVGPVPGGHRSGQRLIPGNRGAAACPN